MPNQYSRARKAASLSPETRVDRDPQIEEIVHQAIKQMREQGQTSLPPIRVPTPFKLRPPTAAHTVTARSATLSATIPQAQPKKLKTRVQVLQAEPQPPYTATQPLQYAPPGPARATHRTVGSKEEVYAGSATRTAGGLTKVDLVVNSRGQIVSKRRSDNAKIRFGGGPTHTV